MQRKSYIWLFTVVVVTVPFVVYGLVSWYQNRFQRLPVLGPQGHAISNFQFQNQNGQGVVLEDWKGKVVVANYFFTRCPSICPKMFYQLKRVQAYADVKNLQLASFTVDPEHDTLERLQAYAQKQGVNSRNWSLLTGNKKELYRLARNSFLITATDGDGGPEDFIHSERLVLVDAQQRIRGFYNGTEEAAVNQLIKDIKKVAEERP